jgi:hypothetical protein
VRRHETDWLSLTFGGVFLMIAAVHFATQGTGSAEDLRWVIPTVLLVLGALGIIGATRGDRPASAAPAAPSSAGTYQPYRPYGASPADRPTPDADTEPTIRLDTEPAAEDDDEPGEAPTTH